MGKYHFTFLALSSHKWKATSELPTEVKDLKRIVNENLKEIEWRLDSLRVVPGTNFLLLAGVPNQESVVARNTFAQRLMNSPWRIFIEERHEYKGYPFPPLIWHRTLCRYKREYFSRRVRDIYRRYADWDFGSLQLQSPSLRAINYDWSLDVSL